MKNIFYFICLFVYTLLRESDYAECGKVYNSLEMYEVIYELSGDTIINANRKLVFFRIIKKKKRNYDKYLNYLREFLLNTGVKSALYNWENTHFVAVTFMDAYITKEEILSRFKGVIAEIGEQTAKDVLPMFSKAKTDL